MAEITIQLKKGKKLTVQSIFLLPPAFCLLPSASCLLGLELLNQNLSESSLGGMKGKVKPF
jgi:hypothetical protein